MTEQRGFRVKLLPTPEQEEKFWQFAGTRRFAYNWALDTQMKSYEETGKNIDRNELCKMFVQMKNTDPEKTWLKDISCDVAKQAIKDLCEAYDRYFKKMKEPGYVPFTKSKIIKSQRNNKPLTNYDRNGHPKFKKKLNCDEGFHQDCMHVRFTDNYIYIAKIGLVEIAKDDIFPQGLSGKDFKIYNAKVKTDGEHWYFVAALDVPSEQLNKVEDIPKSEPVGIDLGIKDLAILSDGTKFKNINKTRKVQKLEKRRRRLQRKVSKKYKRNKKGDEYVKTSNSIRLQKKILDITHKLTNIRTNYRHQTTTAIVKRNPIFIALEDLNVKGMMKNKHLSKSISEQGWGYFRTYLKYKCESNNIPLVFVDRWYPSSKTCSYCGNIYKELKLSDRVYICPKCGFKLDRDINAAINIRNYGQNVYEKSIISAQ